MSISEKNSFFDPKTLMAVATVFGLWFLWDNHMQNKYPHMYKKDTVNTKTVNQAGESNSVKKESLSANLTKTQRFFQKDNKAKPSEKIYKFESDLLKISISNFGMGFKSVTLKTYKGRDGKNITLGSNGQNQSGNIRLFETRLKDLDEVLYFNITRVNETTFRGVSQSNGMIITKILQIDPKGFSMKSKVLVSGIKPSFKGLTTYILEKEDKSIEEPSLFSPALINQEIFIGLSDKESERISLPDVKEEAGSFKNSRLISLGSPYFNSALLNRSTISPSVDYFFSLEEEALVAKVHYQMLNKKTNFEIQYTIYTGPKDLNIFKHIDEQMLGIVDFGWFGSIGGILLNLLDFFYSFTKNWGVSIILLTFLVRLILLPLNIISYKSMKNMQVVQPLIKAVREKHKGDPQRMNKEVMAIMKNNKANPAAGCLPMFLQFPIFIALYRVLGASIQLYQAPFAFWIDDLSLKDPIYILPVLMGIAMFFQMRLTPTAADNTQKKIMMFMPVMFTFFMLSLPSGLTLYMLVTTLFGVAQHFIFMKDKKV